MSRERTENLAETALNGSITSGQTNLTVQSTSGFPLVPQFRVTVGDNAEIMLVTSIAGSVYQVDRAPEGPAAVAHGDGAAVRLTQTREGQRHIIETGSTHSLTLVRRCSWLMKTEQR